MPTTYHHCLLFSGRGDRAEEILVVAPRQPPHYFFTFQWINVFPRAIEALSCRSSTKPFLATKTDSCPRTRGLVQCPGNQLNVYLLEVENVPIPG